MEWAEIPAAWRRRRGVSFPTRPTPCGSAGGWP